MILSHLVVVGLVGSTEDHPVDRVCSCKASFISDVLHMDCDYWDGCKGCGVGVIVGSMALCPFYGFGDDWADPDRGEACVLGEELADVHHLGCFAPSREQE